MGESMVRRKGKSDKFDESNAGGFEIAFLVVRVVIFLALFCSVFAMLGLFGLGFWDIGKGIQESLSNKAVVDSVKYIFNSSNQAIMDSVIYIGAYPERKPALESAVRGIEFLLLGPLPFLIILVLGRYLEKMASGSGKGMEEARGNLLTVKAFSISLLIAVIATTIVAEALENERIEYESAIAGSIVIVVLAGYLFGLEKFALLLGAKEEGKGNEETKTKVSGGVTPPIR